jgi:outer membrane immunogenic protein
MTGNMGSGHAQSAGIFFAFVGLGSFFGGSAFAADLPPAAPPPPRAPAVYVPAVLPVYNWAGVYVGINGGYGFGSSTWTDPLNPAGTSSGSFSTNGGLVGGTLGVNFQASEFVFGVEGDIDWQTLKGSSANVFCTSVFTSGAVDSLPAGASCETKSNWIGTIRGRIGYAADRVLFYATAGGAFGNVEVGLVGLPLQSTTEFGWTAGAGLEFAFADNWTAKVEYLYASLGNSSCNTAASCGFDATATIAPTAAVPANDTVKLTESMIRAGVNFKFNF